MEVVRQVRQVREVCVIPIGRTRGKAGCVVVDGVDAGGRFVVWIVCYLSALERGVAFDLEASTVELQPAACGHKVLVQRLLGPAPAAAQAVLALPEAVRDVLAAHLGLQSGVLEPAADGVETHVMLRLDARPVEELRGQPLERALLVER
eukprot:369633-Prymnesium_polylepis.2